MRLVALTCGSCGATVEVTSTTEQFTCSFCRAVQVVQRSNGVLIAHGLAGIQSGTDRMAAELALVRLHGERASVCARIEDLKNPWSSPAPPFEEPLPEVRYRRGLVVALFADKAADEIHARQMAIRESYRQAWAEYRNSQEEAQRELKRRQPEIAACEAELAEIDKQIAVNRGLVGSRSTSALNYPRAQVQTDDKICFDNDE